MNFLFKLATGTPLSIEDKEELARSEILSTLRTKAFSSFSEERLRLVQPLIVWTYVKRKLNTDESSIPYDLAVLNNPKEHSKDHYDGATVLLFCELIIDLLLPPKVQKRLDTDMENVLEQVQPEIEMLYSAIKKVGLKRGNPEKWQNAVLKYFDKPVYPCKFMKRSYLENNNLYDFAASNEKRDFYGRLQQQILYDQSGESIGAQFLASLKNKKLD